MEVRSIGGFDAAVRASAAVARTSRPRPAREEDEEGATAPKARDGPAVSEQQRRQKMAEESDASRVAPVIESRSLRLRVDERTERIVTQIVDSQNQVVRQVPPEELLKYYARFRRMYGELFDASI